MSAVAIFPDMPNRVELPDALGLEVADRGPFTLPIHHPAGSRAASLSHLRTVQGGTASKSAYDMSWPFERSLVQPKTLEVRPAPNRRPSLRQSPRFRLE